MTVPLQEHGTTQDLATLSRGRPFRRVDLFVRSSNPGVDQPRVAGKTGDRCHWQNGTRQRAISVRIAKAAIVDGRGSSVPWFPYGVRRGCPSVCCSHMLACRHRRCAKRQPLGGCAMLSGRGNSPLAVCAAATTGPTGRRGGWAPVLCVCRGHLPCRELGRRNHEDKGSRPQKVTRTNVTVDRVKSFCGIASGVPHRSVQHSA